MIFLLPPANALYRQHPTQDADLRVDYVQIRRLAEVTDVKALVFSTSAATRVEGHIRVSIKVDTRKQEISEASCEKCKGKSKEKIHFQIWSLKI